MASFKNELETLNRSAESNLLNQLVSIDPSRRYVLFADDNPAILSLISVFMQSHGLNNFILSENINSAMSVIKKLNGGFHHIVGFAVLDIDFGVMGGNVNDLIRVLLDKEVPVVICSALNAWKKYIDSDLIDKITYVSKGEAKWLSMIYDKVIEEFSVAKVNAK